MPARVMYAAGSSTGGCSGSGRQSGLMPGMLGKDLAEAMTTRCCRHCAGRPSDGEMRQAFRGCIARSSGVAPAAHSSVPAAVAKRIAMAGSAGSNATAPGMPAAAWKGNATR